METPTRRQREILDLICGHIVATGQPPTVREVAALAKISSPNGVMAQVRALRQKGHIEPDAEDMKARGIWPTGLRKAVQTAASKWWKGQK